jgi:hypothetical protein
MHVEVLRRVKITSAGLHAAGKVTCRPICLSTRHDLYALEVGLFCRDRGVCGIFAGWMTSAVGGQPE